MGLALANSLHAAEVKTVADVQVLGGQHFFEGAVSSVAGNINAVVTPSVTWNEKWSFYPTWQAEYRGTRDVQELAGGGSPGGEELLNGEDGTGLGGDGHLVAVSG